MPFLRRHWPVLLVVLFPLLPLWRAVFLGEAIGPFDQIRQMAPWNGPAPDRPFDVLQADAVLQFYPWRDMVFEAWGMGQLPLWNPYQLAGTPLLANSQSAGFYPPHLLMGLLHVPTAMAITLLAWFHLAMAGLGAMALSRRLGASREGAAIGGVLFSGSAFMLAWTALPSVISTCAWIPWVLAGVYGLFGGGEGLRAKGEENDERGTTNDERGDKLRAKSEEEGLKDQGTEEGQSSIVHRQLPIWRTTAFLAVSVAMMLLAGHLQFAFYGLLAAGFVLVWLTVSAFFDKTHRSYRTYSFGRLGLGILALGLGAGLAAPQLLPVMEYSKFSHRRNVPTEDGYKAYVAGAIAPFELVGLVYPTAVGLPFEFAPEHKPLSQYWPALVKQGANFAEGAIGIGPLALFGLLLFPWRSSPRRLWGPLAALGVIAFLMALGTVVNKPFYFLIPGWSSTGSPGRIGVLFVLAACVLAGVGLQQLVSHATAKSALVIPISLTLLAGIVSWHGTSVVSGQLMSRFPGLAEDSVGQIAAKAAWHLSSGLFLVVGFSLLLVVAGTEQAQRNLNRFRLPAAAFFLFLIPNVWGLWRGIVPTGQPLSTDRAILSPPNNATPQHRNTGRMAFINEPWELVVAAPATLPPNTASLFRIPDLAGYDSLLHKDTHLFLGEVNGQDPAPPANGNIQYVKPTADLDKLREAGVSAVLSRRPVFPSLQPKTLENGLLLYLLGVPGRIETPPREQTKPDPAPTLVDGYDRQIVTATGPGTLVVKDRLMPGWSAFIDGKPVEWSPNSPKWKAPDGREITLWRAVELSHGLSRVEFRYNPPGLRTGFTLFGACLLATAGCLIVGGRRKE